MLVYSVSPTTGKYQSFIGSVSSLAFLRLPLLTKGIHPGMQLRECLLSIVHKISFVAKSMGQMS